MRRQTGILLAASTCLCLACLLICCGGTLFAGVAKTVSDASQAPEIGRQISNYRLPAGYAETTASSIGQVKSVSITNKTDINSILRQSIALIHYRGVKWTVVGTRPVTIRGEHTVLTIYTGVGPDNKQYRAWAADFTAKAGRGLLDIVGRQDTWDETAMQAFVDSMY